MKVCIVQPGYSMDFSKSDAFFQWEMEAFDKCDESMDIIVFPEYSDLPCYAATKKEMRESYEKYNKLLMQKAEQTARRCGAVVFINGLHPAGNGLRNTTIAFDKNGDRAGYYFKQHLVEAEMYSYELDKEYSLAFSEPTILTIDGVRYGFLTCYDVYFYELYANMARYNPDVIIVCAYQRSDTHEAIAMMSQFCAYNCNAYVVRSSVSLGEDSPVGGSSMVVAPDGTLLLDMRNETGLRSVEIEPHEKYLKPAGFGNPFSMHHEYIEQGRHPWKYRPGGSAIVLPDELMPYPRLCAHRGFNTIAPENSMPAFGAAIALGAEEIEFDLWECRDGEIVSIHDECLDRVSDGKGFVWEYTCEELRKFDFGSCYGEAFQGLKIPRFEDILKKYACHVIMNIHIKCLNDTDPLPWAMLKKVAALIEKYDCKRYVYFMCGNVTILNQLREIAPDIVRCAGAAYDDPCEDLVEKALKTGSKKIQLFKPYFEHNEADYVKKQIEKAHANGIRCNMFWSDDLDEAREFLEMGVDTILTNDYQRIENGIAYE